jgi:hypothetical protein
MVATSKTILPCEPGYVGNKEAKKRHEETKERLRQRDQAGQVPLLKFPENLADKIGGSGPVDEPEVKSRDELRKLLRVLWRRQTPWGAHYERSPSPACRSVSPTPATNASVKTPPFSGAAFSRGTTP